jgi:nicotinamidase-related amidase
VYRAVNGDFGRLETTPGPPSAGRLTWRNFLTERDRAHLRKVWEKKEPFGFGASPAVLVIDLYYLAVGLTREPLLQSVESAPGSCGLEGWAAIDRTAELLTLARAHGVPVLYVKGMDPPARPRDKHERREHMLEHLSPELKRRGNEIVEEVAPLPGDFVFSKPAASAFMGTPLAIHLRSIGADTLICCGETTSGCVRATVVEGAALRYRIGVVEECCFDRTEMSHHVNLFDMNQKSADVLSIPDVAAYFDEVKPLSG